MTVPALYNKLLRLYPHQFRERLGESMQQTFHDLYNEKRQARQGLFGFTIQMFTETAIGIAHEHVLLLTESNPMKNFLIPLRSPALISLLFVIPFMIMEVVTTQNLNAIVNVPLFGIMWFLPMIFILILMPIMRNVHAGNNLTAKPVILVFSVILLVLIALAWGGIVADQMPCFLGVPNCD